MSSPGIVSLAFFAAVLGGGAPCAGGGAAQEEDQTPALIVQFEGGRVEDNVSAVLGELVKGGYVETRSFPLAAGEGLCDVYRTKAQLPGDCTTGTLELAFALNPRARNHKALPRGFEVEVPAVELVPYNHTVTLDPSVAADRVRSKELKTFWKEQLLDQKTAPNGAERLVFMGYRLTVPTASDEALAELHEKLLPYQSPNVVVTPVYLKPPPVKLYSATSRYWDACVAGTPLTAGALDLGALVGAAPERCAATCQGDCSEVVVVDTAISHHPDLETSFGGSSQGTPYHPVCQAAFDASVHHGTHLAGIVGADGGEGRIRGVDPGAPLVGVVRDATGRGDVTVAAEIEARATDPLPIFLFASRWQARPCRQRGAGNAIAMRVCEGKPLWIAAVGNDDLEVTTAFPYGPMNLGDERNVVNVTACASCEPGSLQPTILQGTNWSSSSPRMVHVAAPGLDIPGPITTSEYGRASGTSQAAGFVAGVAVAMRNCYPSAYSWPHLVKTRLQSTSRPFPPVPAGEDRADDGLAAGIVAAGVALLDPGPDWVKRRHGDWEEVRIRRWLRSDFSVLHPVSRNLVGPWLRPQDVLRLVRFVPTDPAEDDQWTIYSRVPWDDGRNHLGEVIRTGPGILDRSSADLLELCSGETLALDAVEDLLVALVPEDCP